MKNKKGMHIAIMFLICLFGLFITTGCASCGTCTGKVMGVGCQGCAYGCGSCIGVSCNFMEDCLGGCSN